MWNRCRGSRGFTLVEMIVAIVIISVGLAGVLSAFNQAVRGSADPMIRKQMLAIAEEMMEEITLKPYAGSALSPSGCGRAALADVDDYNGYSTASVCDIDGTAVSTLSGYGVTVAVSDVTLQGVPAKRILVTVSHGTDSFSLTGYRTGWAL